MNLARPLYRSVADRKIAGVAAGVADYVGIDRSLCRVLWFILALFTWGGFGIVYLVMWIVVPEEPAGTVPGEGGADSGSDDPAAPAPATSGSTRNPPSAGVVVGAIFILLGSWFLVRQFVPDLDFRWIWPAALVGVGVVILVAAARRSG